VTDKGKYAADGAVKKGATSTISSNTDHAATPCSTCPAAAAGAPCAAHTDNAS
jgi:hypothetical protein